MLAIDELRGPNCEVEMVSGSNDMDCHRRRFRTKLIQMAMSGYDYVLVEPSGIYDTDEFFDALHEDPIADWYTIGNVITVVDAGLTDSLSRESRYVLTSESANSGIIIMSKVQLASPGADKHTKDIINSTMLEFDCDRKITDDDILAKNWKELTEDDFTRINSCGYKYADHIKLQVMDSNDYDSMFFMNEGLVIDKDELIKRAGSLIGNGPAGHVIRIKGTVKDLRGSFTAINLTEKESEISTVKNGMDILIVIGEDIDKDKIRKVITGGKE